MSAFRGIIGIGALCALTSACALQSAPARPGQDRHHGANGGGFFATHPATADRIEALRKVH